MNKCLSISCFICVAPGIIGNANSMGLRSFVALPVEKGGAVVRFSLEHAEDADTDTLSTSAAYGISDRQTLLLGLPYRLSPAGSNRQGDISVLYRHIVRQEDSLSGTKRLGLLAGGIVPTDTERDAAIQAGFVYTYFKNQHEVDLDALYQAGIDDRADSGRYDLSWQYRLLPAKRPDWGIVKELYSVMELNGRWKEGSNITHQITAGVQWVHQKWVLEGGIIKDLNNDNEQRYLFSTRFHF